MLNRLAKSIGLVGALALITAGCSEKPATKPPVKDPVKVAKKDIPAPNKDQSHPECVGPMTEAPVESFEVSGKKFERKGSTLNIVTEDADDEFIIGHLTDVKDYSPENAANIRVAKSFFKKEKVDLVAITGDLGESVESIEKVLTEVADLGVPILVIAGNRECRTHFTAALNKVSAAHKNVINMNTIRVVNADDASFVSLPGYYNRSYIHCADGCEYSPDDVKALEGFTKLATAPAKVILSHGPPEMAGQEKGLDRIHEGVNVGDPELAAFLKKGSLPFGLFGNIQEAGGHATDLSGKKVIEQGAFADSLYLNPGPIDAVRWAMLDGTESLGMAGLMKIKGKQASYKVYRVKEGEAKVDGK
ncbi:MAG: hypothetical protein GY822_06260 [Deltaproteobacteria bacterium]|nr:hypothetical protein [Deltaproteobacteria bacterium]